MKWKQVKKTDRKHFHFQDHYLKKTKKTSKTLKEGKIF